MRDVKWLFNRMKAMNLSEVLWRIQQKALQKKEYNLFFLKNKPVTLIGVPQKIADLEPNIESLHIVWDNESYSLFEELDLFGLFSYDQYKSKWNAGFQTENCWPENDFSYKINCSQQTHIGDIRTNWELNRHFQFSALAKSYYVTGDSNYLNEFQKLFAHWNLKNKFLHGVQWTSPMEIAIRVNSWILTYSFFKKAFIKHNQEDNDLLNEILNGIKVMVSYVIKHRAKGSSANNHLIVEMYSVAVAGIFLNYKSWIALSVKTLTKQLQKQNYSDGVNKEMSLHYQSFIMEAYGFLIRLMGKNGIAVPNEWLGYLKKMSEFLKDCCGEHGETIVFGDNDEGKIFDLSGEKFDHYRYVLDLMSLVLNDRYSKVENIHENLSWHFTKQEIDQALKKKLYISPLSKCYKQGGYTFLRSFDNRILIGIDHASLGYGKIAAHGHSDALSFQMFVAGVPVFVDPGTYNYHVTPEDRDYFRRTENHNTITVDGKDQAEMLGPFLWGKKYSSNVIAYNVSDEKVVLVAGVEYRNIKHIRKFTFDYQSTLTIQDQVNSKLNFEMLQPLHLGATIQIKDCSSNNYILFDGNNEIQLKYQEPKNIRVEQFNLSNEYNHKLSAVKIVNENRTDRKASFEIKVI